VPWTFFHCYKPVHDIVSSFNAPLFNNVLYAINIFIQGWKFIIHFQPICFCRNDV